MLESSKLSRDDPLLKLPLDLREENEQIEKHLTGKCHLCIQDSSK
jgi:hypothetical protein